MQRKEKNANAMFQSLIFFPVALGMRLLRDLVNGEIIVKIERTGEEQRHKTRDNVFIMPNDRFHSPVDTVERDIVKASRHVTGVDQF